MTASFTQIQPIMTYEEGFHVTITFAPINCSSIGSFAKDGRAQCDRVSLHRVNVEISDVKDTFQESETI